MDLPATIFTNPLTNICINARTKTPKWLCAHPDAKVMDIEKQRYHCLICNPKSGNVRKIPQPVFLSHLRKDQLLQN